MNTATPYVTTQELAAILGIHRWTVHKWKRDKKIPAPRKAGDKRIYHLPSVLEACRRNCLKIDPLAYQLVSEP
jgi:excisionase family DNA binding protein